MRVVLQEPMAVCDLSSGKPELKRLSAGVHEVETTTTFPASPENPWIVLKGSKTGGRESSWRDFEKSGLMRIILGS